MTSHKAMSRDKIPFPKKYLLRQNFVREYILAEGILSEKVFRRRRYFVLEGIMSGYQSCQQQMRHTAEIGQEEALLHC